MAASAGSLEEKDQEFRKMNKTALIVGYTGATGAELVKELAKRNLYSKVKLVGRRKVDYDDNRKDMEQVVVDFDQLEEKHGDAFKGADHVFCCLGTIQQKGEEIFRRVDYDYIMRCARLSKAGGDCREFHLMSSTGADKNSRFLYPRTKGQVEAEVTDLEFDRAVYYRPGFLSAERGKARSAPEWFLRTVFAGLSKITTAGSIPVEKVARAMVNVALTAGHQNVEILDNKTIHKLADQK